jgi:hypothetical protein
VISNEKMAVGLSSALDALVVFATKAGNVRQTVDSFLPNLIKRGMVGRSDAIKKVVVLSLSLSLSLSGVVC